MNKPIYSCEAVNQVSIRPRVVREVFGIVAGEARRGTQSSTAISLPAS